MRLESLWGKTVIQRITTLKPYVIRANTGRKFRCFLVRGSQCAKGCSCVAKADKVNDGIALVRLCLQGNGLIVVEVNSPLPYGLLGGIAFVGDPLMQLRLVEGREDLRKANGEAVPVVFRVGEDYDMVFRGTHLRRDTIIPQWFQASKAAAPSDGHAMALLSNGSHMSTVPP